MNPYVTFQPIPIQLAGGTTIPLTRMVKIRQSFPAPRIEKLEPLIQQELNRETIAARIKPGEQIALTVGSRGIASISTIIRTIADELKRWGAHPFIVPAMGSHGGATAEGQLQVLAEYGITEESMGVPIRSSMEVVQLATLPSGVPVYMDRIAHEADGVVVIGRVKPHTDFKGPIESGLMKMLAIGLGKHKGAATLHAEGFDRFHELVPEAGQAVLDNASIRFGVAILENAYEETAEIVAIPSEDILETEALLLAKAKSYMPRLPVNQIDLLVVDRIGKDISGAGMDPNIIGRLSVPTKTAQLPSINRIVALDLTEKTHGNGVGIGFADVTTRRLANKLDLAATYANTITSTVLEGAKIPLVVNNDREAIIIALKGCNRVTAETARIVRIHNTLELSELYVSEALLAELMNRSDIEILSEPEEWPFDEQGNLLATPE